MRSNHRVTATFSCLAFGAAILAALVQPARAMQQCPHMKERFKAAKVVVEARVKALSVGDSGFLVPDPVMTRLIRADIEIVRVIKGSFDGNEAILYGSVYPYPGPLRELNMMALIYGDPRSTFQIELSRWSINSKEYGFLTLNGCIYWKFPDVAFTALEKPD